MYKRQCIDKVNKVLAKLQAMQGEFTINELKKELNEEFKDKIITENIANVILIPNIEP